MDIAIGDVAEFGEGPGHRRGYWAWFVALVLVLATVAIVKLA